MSILPSPARPSAPTPGEPVSVGGVALTDELLQSGRCWPERHRGPSLRLCSTGIPRVPTALAADPGQPRASLGEVLPPNAAPAVRRFRSAPRGRTAEGGDGRPRHWIDGGTRRYPYQSEIEAMDQAVVAKYHNGCRHGRRRHRRVRPTADLHLLAAPCDRWRAKTFDPGQDGGLEGRVINVRASEIRIG